METKYKIGLGAAVGAAVLGLALVGPADKDIEGNTRTTMPEGCVEDPSGSWICGDDLVELKSQCVSAREVLDNPAYRELEGGTRVIQLAIELDTECRKAGL